MLVPPFAGAPAVLHQGITDDEGFIRTDLSMRVRDVERMYAVGDAVGFPGPKMGHMAVRQAEVAAANVRAEIEGREPDARYAHEVKFVIDAGDKNAVYLPENLWDDEPGVVRQGRF